MSKTASKAAAKTLPQLKQYACLVDGCKQIFGTWSDARVHMKQNGHRDAGLPKPNLKDSAAKAKEIIASDPELSAIAAAQEALPKPWENVSEEELVELIRPFYNRTDLSAHDKRKHVKHRVIEPKYGRFEFGKFGLGTFDKFLERNGFEEKGHKETYRKQGAFRRNR